MIRSAASGRCRDHLMFIDTRDCNAVFSSEVIYRERVPVLVHLGGDCELDDFHDMAAVHDCSHIIDYGTVARAWFAGTALLDLGNNRYVYIDCPVTTFTTRSPIISCCFTRYDDEYVARATFENGATLKFEAFADYWNSSKFYPDSSEFIPDDEWDEISELSLVTLRDRPNRHTLALVSNVYRRVEEYGTDLFLPRLAAAANLLRKQTVDALNEKFEEHYCGGITDVTTCYYPNSEIKND